MIKIELLRDTIVRHPKGTVVEVTEEEAKRLIAFGNGKKAEAPKKATKK